jgi:TonB family protein
LEPATLVSGTLAGLLTACALAHAADPAPATLFADDVAVASHTPLAYPADAEAATVAGVVVMRLQIDADGGVRDAFVVAGDSRLAGAAERNVRTWRFAAGPRHVGVIYDFQLGGPACKGPGAGSFLLHHRNVATVVGCSRLTRPAPGDIVDGAVRVTHRPDVPYPAVADSARLGGFVVVDASVDGSGIVTDAVALAGPRVLVDASVTNARTWRFTPGQARRILIGFDYTIGNEPCTPPATSVVTQRQRTIVSVTSCGQLMSP